MRLDQLRHLNKEIEILQEQIRKVETVVVTDVVVGSDVEYPYLAHNITIAGIESTKAQKLKRRLARRIKQLAAAREEMLEYISTVKDSEMRQILILRYIDGFTWPQVARRMGRQGDGSTERKKHDRYLGFRGS